MRMSQTETVQEHLLVAKQDRRQLDVHQIAEFNLLATQLDSAILDLCQIC